MFKEFDSVSFCGYEQITTFFMDFSIADYFGIDAVQDTYQRAFEEWRTDYKFLTELVMVLNWKAWQHANNAALCKLYSELFYEAQDYAYDHLKGDELTYFIRTTD